MSNVVIMVHAVWSTKDRNRILEKEKREVLFQHILEYAETKEIVIDCIGGYTNHVHCLIALGTMQSIGVVLKYIKGESAYWANQQKLFPEKLEWNKSFTAFAISKKEIPMIRNYILTQEEKHSREDDDRIEDAWDDFRVD